MEGHDCSSIQRFTEALSAGAVVREQVEVGRTRARLSTDEKILLGLVGTRTGLMNLVVGGVEALDKIGFGLGKDFRKLAEKRGVNLSKRQKGSQRIQKP